MPNMLGRHSTCPIYRAVSSAAGTAVRRQSRQCRSGPPPGGVTDRAAGFGRVVRGWGDRQAVLSEHGADRVDPELVAVSVDVVDDHRSRRSTSAAAKNAVAVFKISRFIFSRCQGLWRDYGVCVVDSVFDGEVPQVLFLVGYEGRGWLACWV
jgi:hypothetical protein